MERTERVKRQDPPVRTIQSKTARAAVKCQPKLFGTLVPTTRVYEGVEVCGERRQCLITRM